MKAWREAAALELLLQRVQRRALAVPVRVFIEAFPPHNHRRHDLDNVLKASLDLLVRVHVLEDDSFVSELRLVRRAPDGEGRLDVALSPWRPL